MSSQHFPTGQDDLILTATEDMSRSLDNTGFANFDPIDTFNHEVEEKMAEPRKEAAQIFTSSGILQLARPSDSIMDRVSDTTEESVSDSNTDTEGMETEDNSTALGGLN